MLGVVASTSTRLVRPTTRRSLIQVGRRHFGKKSSRKKTKGKGRPKVQLKLGVVDDNKAAEKVLDPKVKEWNEAQIAKLKNKASEEDRIGVVASNARDSMETATRTSPHVLTDGIYAALPKGAIVYHGTSLGKLKSILNSGKLEASAPDLVFLSAYQPPRAVFVGSLLKALCHATKPAVEGIFSDADPEDLFPMVLELEVQNSADIGIDPDFFITGKGRLSTIMMDVDWDVRQDFYVALHLDQELAAISWSKFLSAGVLADIPASWIRGIYSPRLQADGRVDSSYFKLAAMAIRMDLQKEANPMGIPSSLVPVEDSDLGSLSKRIDFDVDVLRAGVGHLLQKDLGPILAKCGGDLEAFDRLMLENCLKHANVNVSEIIARIRRNYT